MPAVTADTLTLPRLAALLTGTDWRGVGKVVTAHRQLEGRDSSSAGHFREWISASPTRSFSSTSGCSRVRAG